MNPRLFSPHIIRSLFDLDAYKINMMQAIHHFIRMCRCAMN